MHAILRDCLLLFLLLFMSPASPAAQPGQSPTEQEILEVFVREGCPHCGAAKAYLPAFAAERPWLRVVYRPVDEDPDAREDLIRHSRNAGLWPPGVPTFVFKGRILVGFDSPERTGPELVALVEESLPEAGMIESALFGTLSVSRMGLPLFTLAIGLLDGFNPCAMWVLLFLLSMLVHVRDRRRMALVAGTFVLVSGAVYYAFMAAWLNVFLLVGMSGLLRVGLGSVALLIGVINMRDFAGRESGFSLSIPASAKPGIYARMRSVVQAESLAAALIGVTILAVVVNFIELMCTAGFPAIYTAILTRQDLPAATHYAYLGLYIAGYIADDSLMVATAVIALSSRKLTERAGRWLKLASGLVMFLLGAAMIFRPEWLM
ncbi:MAG TPA: glutaredoxin domain-containing protein [Noviherbaspirillum sp.]